MTSTKGMLAALLAASGCATLGSSIGMSYDEGELKKSVAFETHCPEASVRVREAMEAGVGHSKFLLDVCGKDQRWVRLGTSYFAEGKTPMDSLGVPAAATPPPTAPAVAEAAPPRPPTASAPSGETGNLASGEYAALVKRVADLELRVAGKKTNAQLIADLNNPADDAWKLRLDATRALGERKAWEAKPALEKVVASSTASAQLKQSASAALEQISAASAPAPTAQP